MQTLIQHIVCLGLLLSISTYNSVDAISAQQEIGLPIVSKETSNKVFDTVFPRDPGNFRDFKKQYSLVIRFKPSFSPESQINIIKYREGKVEAVVYTLPQGSKSVSEQLNDMLRRDRREDAKKMAKAIQIERRIITDSKRLHQLLEQFVSMSLPSQLNTDVTLDGTRFELWYETASNEYYYSLVGGEPGEDQKDHLLLKWMNEVRQALIK